MKTILTTLLILASLILTACPARTIQKAKSASANLATYANTGVDVTRELYRNNLITLAQKDKIADAFIVLANGGIAFDLAVKNAEQVYGGATPPRRELDALFATFNAEVVAKFLAVLQSLKLVNNTGAIGTVIESLKTAVLLIAAAFKHKSQVEAAIAI